MAIPISWPSSEEVEDSYRSLDLLLEQLLQTIRQVLVQRHQQEVLANLPNRQCTAVPQPAQVPPAVPLPTVPNPRLPLPDLVPDLGECDGPRSRKDPSLTQEASPLSTWTQTGAQLRHIADSFRTQRQTEQAQLSQRKKRKIERNQPPIPALSSIGEFFVDHGGSFGRLGPFFPNAVNNP